MSMASQPRTRTREEERRLSIRTLAIASIASATAAIVTSQFWAGGTPIAAALTPVIVTLVSEMLHRPTEAIASRVTMDRTALLPEAGGAGPPPEEEETRPRVARDLEGEPAPVRVYRPPARRRIPIRVVAVTAVLAFAIGVAVLTLPELIAGQSLGKGDRDTTIFGGRKDHRQQEEQPQQTVPQETQPQRTEPEEPRTAPAPQQPERTEPEQPTTTTPTETVPPELEQP
jgi:hypothetical protein